MSRDGKTLAVTGDVYECCGSVRRSRYRVSWPELGAFWRDLRNLRRRLGDESHEAYWEALIRPLRRYVFLLSSTPLSTGDPAVYPAGLIEQLDERLRRVHLLYPDLASDARVLLKRFADIVSKDSNPLLEELDRIFNTRQGEATALILKEIRFTAAVERVQSSRPSLSTIKVVATHQLRGEQCYDNAIILGAPSWYPEYVLTAPRAREIHIVAYSWLDSSWKPEAAFLGSQPSNGALSKSLRGEDYRMDAGAEDLVVAEDLFPQINLDTIAERFARAHEAEREYELVDARMFSLEGGASVFIEASDTAKALIIDPEADEDGTGQTRRLRRIPVSYIEPAMYLLLRTYGGGDYIVPVADKILGAEAKHKRTSQEHWKRLLSEEVNRRGIFPTCIALLDLESIRADEVNVRNWMSNRTIHPDDKRDFEAIMKLVGLQNKTDEYWANAKALTTAHRAAGKHIRALLLKEVKTADLDELERMGRMDFVLPAEDAGSFTAFRILGNSRKKYKVPLSHLDQPFESGAGLWLE